MGRCAPDFTVWKVVNLGAKRWLHQKIISYVYTYIQTEVGISDELKKKVIGYYEYLVCKTLKEAVAVTITTGMTKHVYNVD